MTAKNTTNEIKNHPLFSESDYQYFTSKGYTNEEILEIWNRDFSKGLRTPVQHEAAPDLVGYLNQK